ncbi:MAG: GNAT family N-acetyltransferase [Planctomycetota bacterium]|nr:GNAT family N-acetyltransferase [Planctomycetota bacterium]
MKRNVATVIVATGDDSPSVLGFYTLSAASVDLSPLPDATRKKLPRYGRIPAVLLGRLAVAKGMRRTGLGGLLIADAVKRACRGEIAWAVFVVRAKHDDAVAFYRHFGFVPFEGDPLMLWIARKAALSAIGRRITAHQA